MKVILVIFLLLSLCRAHGPEPDKIQEVRKACGRSICVLTPEETQGPYYWYNLIARNDIVEEEEGIPFTLAIQVYEISNCSVLTNVGVDIWHCNGLGDYSHFIDQNTNDPDNTTFLRGVSPTDSTGIATFYTVYPGWYTGRTVHIHIKVHIGGYVAANGSYVAGNVSHTGQLYFDDEFTTATQSYAPYNRNNNERITNDQDGIFIGGGGNLTIIAVKPIDEHDFTKGVVGQVLIWVNSTAIPAPDGPTTGPPPTGSFPPTGPPPTGPNWPLSGGPTSSNEAPSSAGTGGSINNPNIQVHN